MALRSSGNLLKLPGFARLQSALFVNNFGNWMLTVALPLYVLRVTGSTLQTATTLAIEVVVRLTCGQVAGVWVDRWNRRIAFVAISIGQAAGLLPLIAVHTPNPKILIVYAVAAVQSLLGTVSGPSVGALLPTIVPREQRVAANSLGGVLSDISQLLGGAAGGVVLGFSGFGLVVACDSATFLIAAALLSWHLVDGERPPARTGRRSVFTEWREGIAIVLRSRGLVGVYIVGFVIFFGQGLFLVLFAYFAIHTAHLPDTVAGVLRVVVAAGTLIGGGILTLIGDRFRPHTLTFFGLVGSGLFMALAWNGPIFHAPVIWYVAAFCLFGVPNVAAYVGMSTIFQDETPDEARGRVFSLFGAVNNVSVLAGIFTAGLLTAHVHAEIVLNIQALAFVVGGVIAWPLLRPRDHEPVGGVAPEPRPALDGVVLVDD
jgi:MFS family permease